MDAASYFFRAALRGFRFGPNFRQVKKEAFLLLLQLRMLLSFAKHIFPLFIKDRTQKNQPHFVDYNNNCWGMYRICTKLRMVFTRNFLLRIFLNWCGYRSLLLDNGNFVGEREDHFRCGAALEFRFLGLLRGHNCLPNT